MAGGQSQRCSHSSDRVVMLGMSRIATASASQARRIGLSAVRSMRQRSMLIDRWNRCMPSRPEE